MAIAKFTAFGHTFAIKIVSSPQQRFSSAASPGFSFENLKIPIIWSKIKVVADLSSDISKLQNPPSPQFGQLGPLFSDVKNDVLRVLQKKVPKVTMMVK